MTYEDKAFLLVKRALTDEEVKTLLAVEFEGLYKNSWRASSGWKWEYEIHRKAGLEETLIEITNDRLYRCTPNPFGGAKVTVRRSKPRAFLTDEEVVEIKAKAKRLADLPKATTIRAIQELVLYRVATTDWASKQGDFILSFVNRRMRKAFTWHKGSWVKRPLPAKSKLTICSPLEFTIYAGTTFAKTVENDFGLEIEGREARGET